MRWFSALWSAIVLALSLIPASLSAQEGSNAIYSGTAIAPSSAYIDAYPFFANSVQGNGDISHYKRTRIDVGCRRRDVPVPYRVITLLR